MKWNGFVLFFLLSSINVVFYASSQRPSQVSVNSIDVDPGSFSSQGSKTLRPIDYTTTSKDEILRDMKRLQNQMVSGPEYLRRTVEALGVAHDYGLKQEIYDCSGQLVDLDCIHQPVQLQRSVVPVSVPEVRARQVTCCCFLWFVGFEQVVVPDVDAE